MEDDVIENIDSVSLVSFFNLDLFTSVISYFGSIVLIFGGLIPYVPQYREIKITENADGFSLFVCLALLLANSMRILFWFGHHFELPLLIQSIIMNIAMFAMVHLCIRVKNRTQIIPSQSQVFSDFNFKYFWAWTDFLSYVEFISTFSAAVGVVVYLFIEVPFVIEGIGFLALITEAMLGVPQFYQNFRSQSTEGMSKTMVVNWTIGDVLKTTYFIVKKVPQQFWICGLLQICIDIAIMLQILFYQMSSGRLILKPEKHVS